MKKLLSTVAVAAAAALTMGGCATQEDDTIVVGSQGYYSNEIIAEIFAQALEAEGFTVERQFQLGQRDIYIPALEAGEVDLFPEYTGNLLQYYNPAATETEADAVYAALGQALPSGLRALAMSPATDQDSYNVTAEFAAMMGGLSSLEDLRGVPGIRLGGAPELAERPYGPAGLSSVYGFDVLFDATGDTTVDALVAGLVDMANVYSADPRIQTLGLVTLDDPRGLFLASNVVPIANAAKAERLARVIDPIARALTASDLVALNVRSTQDQLSSAQIATEWLRAKGFIS
jgi:osmoprotectant transport system substrate-binding protein